MWSEHVYSFPTEYNSPVTCIEYDEYYDMLWIGNSKGRMSALQIRGNIPLIDQRDDEMETNISRYASFPTHDPCLRILPNQSAVTSVGQTGIKTYSYGGAPYGSIKLDTCLLWAGLTDELTAGATITSGDAIQNMHDSAAASSHIVSGTSSGHVFLHDMHTMNAEPVMMYEVSSPVVSIKNNGHVIAVAGVDGNIRLLDGKLRSNKSIATIEAHTGSISDMHLQSQGAGAGDMRNLVTCGLSKRVINPYDTNSPFQYTSDLQARLFDLRTQRQLHLRLPPTLPPQMGGGGIQFVRFIQPNQKLNVSNNPYFNSCPSVMLCSSKGLIQISKCDLLGSDNLEAPQIFYAVAEPSVDGSYSETLTSVGVCSTGNFCAVGTSSGMIGHYIRDTDMEVNSHSPSLRPTPKSGDTLLSPPAPKLSLSTDNPVLGTAYTLIKRSSKKEADGSITYDPDSIRLSSSLRSTPSLYKAKLKLTSARTINAELKTRMVKQDFIGIIPNKIFEFHPNSMLYGSANRKAYAICDPRKDQRISERAGEDAGSTLSTQDNCGESNTLEQSTPPGQYIKLRSYRGKQRMLKFDYNLYNTTVFVGLENSNQNAYTNALIQVFYGFSEFCSQALKSQLSVYQHHHQKTLWCELGFLFHMMRGVERNSTTVERVVRPTNFQRTFQLVPEAVAAGLFDESIQRDLQQTLQTFSRFLLSQLNKELETELRDGRGELGRHTVSAQKVNPKYNPNTIDRIFGYSLSTSTEFLQSHVTETAAATARASSIELMYPSLLNASTSSANVAPKGAAAGGQGVSSSTHVSPKDSKSAASSPAKGPKSAPVVSTSFAAVLWSSLQKASYVKYNRGWCAYSDQYEPFKQTRSIVSLPMVMTLLCGETKKDLKDNTLAGALGEARASQSVGNVHTNFWSASVLGKAAMAAGPASNQQDTLGSLTAEVQATFDEQLDGYWLPMELEIALMLPPSLDTGSKVLSVNGKGGVEGTSPPKHTSSSSTTSTVSATTLIVSCRCIFTPRPSSTALSPPMSPTSTTSSVPPVTQYSSPMQCSSDATPVELTRWVVFDGITESIYDAPASQLPDIYPIRTTTGNASSTDASLFASSSDASPGVNESDVEASPETAGAMNEPVEGDPSTEVAKWVVDSYVLTAVVSEITNRNDSIPNAVCHVNKAIVSSTTALSSASGFNPSGTGVTSGAAVQTRCVKRNWYLYNDFVVERCGDAEVLSFKPWRHPSVVFFTKSSYLQSQDQQMLKSTSRPARGAPTPDKDAPSTPQRAERLRDTTDMDDAGTDYLTYDRQLDYDLLGNREVMVPSSVLGLSSLSAVPSIRLHSNAPVDGRNGAMPSTPYMSTSLPRAGDLVAFDGEFVSVALEKTVLTSTGEREIVDEGRQVLARISLLDGRSTLLSPERRTRARGEVTPDATGEAPSSPSSPVLALSMSASPSKQDENGEGTNSSVDSYLSPPKKFVSDLPSTGREGEGSAYKGASWAGSEGEWEREMRVDDWSSSSHARPVADTSTSTRDTRNQSNSRPKRSLRLLADDYILPLEPVLDYVTRFSGIIPEDLNPGLSKHSIITQRAAYLKLRYFIDRKCVFVGHGLQKDFETANIFVPPEQIRDTVELWRLPNQRKISLRFLASYLLKEHIQDEVHDSIEDAKVALFLYRHFEDTLSKGVEHLQNTLRELYQFGNKTNWTIGLSGNPNDYYLNR